MDHYTLLDISSNAGEAEIKKAYFKKIRKFPPDKYPEEFKKIKEAYNILQNADSRKSYDCLSAIPPLFQDMYESATKNLEYDPDKAVSICKEAIKKGAPKEIFLSLLGELHLENSETGKAVKVYEELTALCPQEVSYKVKLAEAYSLRGFTNKALVLFQELYKSGNRDPYFLSEYSKTSKLTDKEKIKVSHELMGQCPELTRDNLDYVLDAFEIILDKCKNFSLSMVKKEYNFIIEYIQHNKQKLHMFSSDIAGILQVFDMQYSQTVHKTGCVARLLEEIKSATVIESKDVKDMVDFLELRIESEDARQDKRLGELIDDAYKLYFQKKKGSWMLSQISDKFTNSMKSMLNSEMEKEELDIKFAMLLGMPDFNKELDILKAEYPKLTAELKEFLDEIENTSNLNYLKNKIEKKLVKKLGYPNGATLKKAEKDSKGGMDESHYVYESDYESEPYRREEKKIGRNDPCPCGSGKKYKHCCGKN